MASFEEHVEFANKLLRIRTAILDGTLFNDHAFQWHDLGAGNIEVTFDHNGGMGISVIAHMENRNVEHDVSYAGYARINYNSESDVFNLMGDETDYQYLPTAPDESWYFQASLVSSDAVLRGAVIMKTLAATPQPGYKQFIIMPIILDKIIARMDQAGI